MANLPDIADIFSYGGVKIDFAPVEDDQTELAAADHNRMANDVAMMAPITFKAWVKFTTSATAPTLVAHNAQWGNGAPVTPVIARTGTGVFTITFPASVNDQLGVSHSLNIRGGHTTAVGNVFANSARMQATSANVVTVYTAASGTANDIAGANVEVFVF